MRKLKFPLLILLATISLTLSYCKKEKNEAGGPLPDISISKKEGDGKVLKVTSASPTIPATGPDVNCTDKSSARTAAALRSISFGDVPASVFYNFTLATAADLEIFLRDCCIRDDVVEVYVDGCLVRTVDSRDPGAPSGSHVGETFRITLPAGEHTIEYRNTISGISSSGWAVSETEYPASTVMFGTCDTGVPNIAGTCTPYGSLVDLIAAQKVGAKNHGEFVSRVAHLTNRWVAAGLITEAQKDAIMSCVAKWK